MTSEHEYLEQKRGKFNAVKGYFDKDGNLKVIFASIGGNGDIYGREETLKDDGGIDIRELSAEEIEQTQNLFWISNSEFGKETE